MLLGSAALQSETDRRGRLLLGLLPGPEAGHPTLVCQPECFRRKLDWTLVGAVTYKLECSGGGSGAGCSASWVRKAEGADVQRER